MLIVYCETCGFRIQEEELNSGKALQVAENKFNCAKCSAAAAAASAAPRRSTPSATSVLPRHTPEGGTARPVSGVTASVRPKSTVLRTASATGSPVEAHADGSRVVRKPFPVVPVAAGGVVALVIFAVVFALSSGTERPVASASKPDGASNGKSGGAEEGRSALKSTPPAANTPVAAPAPVAPAETPEERMRRVMEETARGNAPRNEAPAEVRVAPASGPIGGLGIFSRTDPGDDSVFNDRAQRMLKDIRDWYAKNGNDPWTYKERLETFTQSYRSAPASQDAKKLLAEIKLPEGERPPERMNWQKDWVVTAEASQTSFHEEFDGRRFIYQTHPVDQGKPCVTSRTFTVPADRPFFEFRLRGHDAGDHRHVVQISGVEVLSENIGGKEWRNFTFDLSALKEKSVEIRLIHHNTGWASEFAYLQSPHFVEKPASDARVIPWDARNTAAALASSAPGAIDLLAMIDPAQDAVVGAWKKDGSGLHSTKGKDHRIQIPFIPPPEYDFRVVFTRSEGNNCVTLMGSRGEREFLAMIGGWGDKYAGFSRIGGNHVDKNPARVDLKGRLKNGTRHTAVLQVRNEGLKLLLDGSPLTEWKTNYNDVDGDSAWRPRDRFRLAVGTFESVYTFHAIDVLEIGAQGRPQRGTVARKPAFDAAPSVAEAVAAKSAASNASPDADYAAVSDDAFSLLAKGNARGARELLEKLSVDSRFAALKPRIQLDLDCVKIAESFPRAPAKGAQALADGRPFSFVQTNGKTIAVGKGTKNSVKEASESLITIEQDFGGGKALTRLGIEQLTPQTRYELARVAFQAEADGDLHAALNALLLVRAGQSDVPPRLVRSLLESARKKPAQAAMADHLTQRFESAEKEIAAEQAFQKVEQAIAARKMDDARKLLEALEKEHESSAFWSRSKAAVARANKDIEAALSPREKGLMFEYCRPEGNERFKQVKLRRPELKLVFDWGDNEPAPGVDRDFSIRARGFLRVEKAGRYGFWVRADDYGVLWVGGKKVVDSPNNTTTEGEVELAAGDHPITFEFQDTGGGAIFQIRWRLVGSFDLQDIPESVLFHDPRAK